MDPSGEIPDEDFMVEDIIKYDVPKRILNGEFTDEQMKSMIEIDYNIFIVSPYVRYVLGRGHPDIPLYRDLVRYAYIADDIDSYSLLKDFKHLDEEFEDDSEEIQYKIITDVICEEIKNGNISLECLYYTDSFMDTDRIIKELKDYQSKKPRDSKAKAAIWLVSSGDDGSGSYETSISKAKQSEDLEANFDVINYKPISDLYYKCVNKHCFNSESIMNYCQSPLNDCLVCPTCRGKMQKDLYKQPEIIQNIKDKFFECMLNEDNEEYDIERINLMSKFLDVIKRISNKSISDETEEVAKLLKDNL